MSTKKVKNVNNSRTQQCLYQDNDAIIKFVADDLIMQQCIQPIRTILAHEGHKGKTNPFKEECALNLDQYEMKVKKHLKAKREPTVDFVVCLEKAQLLLVEVKLNATNLHNIAKDIPGKITYSKRALQSQGNFCSFEKTIVVLIKDDDRFEQNKNKLMRLLIQKSCSHAVPFRVNDFYQTYFSRLLHP